MTAAEDRATAAAERRAQIRACHRCDIAGWLLGTDRLPVEPAVKCTHMPPVDDGRYR